MEAEKQKRSVSFYIEGGHKLSGTHRIPGNKNAALPILAATVLADSPVTVRNLPSISDVDAMLNILGDLGARVEYDRDTRVAVIDPTTITDAMLDADLCHQARGSILFAGPLLARCGHALIPMPGGDGIGRRRLDTHFDGFRALGATVREGNPLEFIANGRMDGADMVLDEASVTATENIVMAAVMATGHTSIFNAACEPHVQDLCNALNKMGASISGIGTNKIEIDGVDRLRGADVEVGPDTVEAASFIAAAAATGGGLTLIGARESEFKVLERPFDRLGVHWAFDGEGRMYVPEGQRLAVKRDSSNAIPKIEDGIWPMTPSDVMSVLIVLATRADGMILFFEKMFESRMYFVDNLITMGASIVQCDPHRVVVTGPSSLHGMRVSSPDIRAGMGLIVAALAANGNSEIQNADTIDRGYGSIENTLRELGANITRDESGLTR